MNNSISNINNYLLIGYPKSGKSTFIAALWHVVESEEIDGSLKISCFPEDTEYLHELRGKWLKCEDIERNKTELTHIVYLNVYDTVKENNNTFVFPDISGEIYKNQFESRELTEQFFNMLNLSKGFMFFINPDVLKPILISDALPLIDDLPIPNDDIGEGAWDVKFAPSQVVLVDLLQMIEPHFQGPFRIAVVISAWDLIRNSPDERFKSFSPTEWIKDQLPLLYQFFKANDKKFCCKFYGISAQGSEYANDNSNLQEFNTQSDRIIVQCDTCTSHDITLPLKWLLNEKFS